MSRCAGSHLDRHGNAILEARPGKKLDRIHGTPAFKQSLQANGACSGRDVPIADLALPLLNRFYIQRQTTIRRNNHGKYINSS